MTRCFCVRNKGYDDRQTPYVSVGYPLPYPTAFVVVCRSSGQGLCAYVRRCVSMEEAPPMARPTPGGVERCVDGDLRIPSNEYPERDGLCFLVVVKSESQFLLLPVLLFRHCFFFSVFFIVVIFPLRFFLVDIPLPLWQGWGGGGVVEGW